MERAEVGDIVRQHGFPQGTEQVVRISSEYGVSTQVPPSTYIGAGSSKFIPHGEYDVVIEKNTFDYLIKVKEAIKREERMGR